MISFGENLPPDNLETYRWRGDMGILDRLAYPNLTAIPRNWNMTTMDTARIEERNERFRLALESDSSTSSTTQPQLLTSGGNRNEPSHWEGSMSVTASQSTELSVEPPPKKKR